MSGPRAKDITGQKFGKLTALYKDPERPGGNGQHTYWICECECGNQISVRGSHLRAGEVTACSPVCKKRIPDGEIFGNLTVLNITNERSPNGGAVMYNCKCVCGNTELIASTELRAQRKVCCSKCNTSAGEIEIEKILKINNIQFLKQYKAPGCINPATRRPLAFDFYLPDYNCLIEFDGAQHFHRNPFMQKTELVFEEGQYRDTLKNEFCIKNNIPLIRIPYTWLNKITKEMLLPESSQFLFKNDA